jgi:hypothetical protein|tara:strand:- start:104 stop:673 length:570 start_codon:yes stop_codon:yes gene_type:complete
MGNITLKTGKNRFLDEDYDDGWYLDTVSLSIYYDKDSITFAEINDRGEYRSHTSLGNFEPEDKLEFDSYSCSLATVNKKEFYWLINNIIDIIKEHKSKKKKSKKSIEIDASPQIIIESGKKSFITLEIEWNFVLGVNEGEWGLFISRHHTKSKEGYRFEHYVVGKVYIGEDYFNALKESMFKIKKEIKN